MPTVLAVTLALGSFELAKEGAIVARQSAVEELSALDILCSDKTGELRGGEGGGEGSPECKSIKGKGILHAPEATLIRTNIKSVCTGSREGASYPLEVSPCSSLFLPPLCLMPVFSSLIASSFPRTPSTPDRPHPAQEPSP